MTALTTQAECAARLREWATAEGRPEGVEECGECHGLGGHDLLNESCPRCSGRGWLRVLRARPSEALTLLGDDTPSPERVASLIDLVRWEGAECGCCPEAADIARSHFRCGCGSDWRSALRAECEAMGVPWEEA